MISEIKIKNFKSIADLTLRPGGSVTVLIGENGSGKSNILEAIAFAAAASANKLDDEFLFNRGIRVTDPDWMTTGFASRENPEIKTNPDPILINLASKNTPHPLEMRISRASQDQQKSWHVDYDIGSGEINIEKILSELKRDLSQINQPDFKAKVDSGEFQNRLASLGSRIEAVEKRLIKAGELATDLPARDFLIYAPENSVLRNFEAEGAIRPLGPKGEGLLKLLQKNSGSEHTLFAQDLRNHLQLLGWFDDLVLPSETDEIKGTLKISDRWLSVNGQLFDQRSANEGFLYLLFYFTLFLSQQTPSFFAIDNIDNSLNPKLCAELIRHLASLAKTHGKQVICTTHNPAILDGLNLHEDDQRLYVVRRNSEGHTVVSRVKAPRPRPDGPPVKLSTAFMSGLLGGLPDHF